MPMKNPKPENIKIWKKSVLSIIKSLFIMLETDFFPYLNILGFLRFYGHNALPWN